MKRSPMVIATSCWARTSSGLRGRTVGSIRPSRIPRTTTAVSRRSPRYLGKITPLLGSPTWWPARPMRWRPRATDVGLSTWITRSTAPMSMPSSRLLVATSAGRRPALSSSSISRRCSRAMLPWWARTSSSPASSLRRWARRSARRRLLVKTIVLWWARMSSRIRGWIAGQMLVRISPPRTGPPGCASSGQDLAQAGHVLHGNDDLDLEGLAGPRVDDGHLAALSHAAQEARDRLKGSLGGGQADALERAYRHSRTAGAIRRGSQALETLEAQGEVGAPLGAGDRVDLVHDDLLDVPQDHASLAGQQQVEALGRGDQDVRRVPGEVAALGGRGVSGTARDRDARRILPQALRGQRDARQRCAQVAFHIVGEGLEGADVQDADAPRVPARWRRPGMLDEAVQAPQERGQGLAAAGGGVDEGAPPGADRRPPLGLGRRRGLERRLEPGPHRGPEGCERILAARGHGTPSIGRNHVFVQMFYVVPPRSAADSRTAGACRPAVRGT